MFLFNFFIVLSAKRVLFVCCFFGWDKTKQFQEAELKCELAKQRWEVHNVNFKWIDPL